MLGIIEPPAAERRVRSEHVDLIIPLLLQNISKRGDRREKGRLILHPVVADLRLERKAGGLGKHAAHRPRRAVHGIGAVQRLFPAGKVFILLRQLCELRNTVEGETAAVLLVRIGILHRLEENIDQIPLLFRECNLCFSRIHIIFRYKFGRRIPVPQIIRDVEPDPRRRRRDHQHRAGEPLYAEHRPRLLLLGVIPDFPQKQNHQRGDCDHRQNASQHKGLDHRIARSRQRLGQFKDDLLHLQVAPERKRPDHRGKTEGTACGPEHHPDLRSGRGFLHEFRMAQQRSRGPPAARAGRLCPSLLLQVFNFFTKGKRKSFHCLTDIDN